MKRLMLVLLLCAMGIGIIVPFKVHAAPNDEPSQLSAVKYQVSYDETAQRYRFDVLVNPHAIGENPLLYIYQIYIDSGQLAVYQPNDDLEKAGVQITVRNLATAISAFPGPPVGSYFILSSTGKTNPDPGQEPQWIPSGYSFYWTMSKENGSENELNAWVFELPKETPLTDFFEKLNDQNLPLIPNTKTTDPLALAEQLGAPQTNKHSESFKLDQALNAGFVEFSGSIPDYVKELKTDEKKWKIEPSKNEAPSESPTEAQKTEITVQPSQSVNLPAETQIGEASESRTDGAQTPNKGFQLTQPMIIGGLAGLALILIVILVIVGRKPQNRS